MEVTPTPKAWWRPSLIMMGVGALLAVVSFGGLISQWGRPTSSVATASFFSILLGILIFALGAILLLVKVIRIIFRSNSRS